MAEALILKVIWGVWIAITGGVGYWIKTLVQRLDRLSSKAYKDSDRITRLESETLSEAETIRMMSEMERRVMSNFKEFRLEFKNDLSDFRKDLKEDIHNFKG